MSDEQPTHIDLFSGIGGFALAARWAGFRTVAFCEIDPYCQRVLAKNFLANAQSTGTSQNDGGVWPGIGRISGGQRPNLHQNIFDFDGTRYRGVSLLTGGFPCQPFSVAGKRGGAADDRHLWPQMLRVITEARPAWILGENVPGIIPMELDNVLLALERIGYACRSFVIPACAVDARHRRDRLWIVGRNMAESSCELLDRSGRTRRRRTEPSDSGGSETIPDPNQPRSQGRDVDTKSMCRRFSYSRSKSEYFNPGQIYQEQHRTVWSPEPDVGRVAHGIPKRVDRLRGLGNSIVPQVAFQILREIKTQLLTKE